MLGGRTLLAYTNFFSLNDYRNNGEIIYKYFKHKYGRRSKSGVKIKKNWCDKKLSFKWNKTYWFNEWKI